MFTVLICLCVKFQNVNLLMMGTADALPIEPVTKTTFVEDLTENQLAKAVNIFSARQHICYSALYVIARPSVCPSVRHTDGSVKDV